MLCLLVTSVHFLPIFFLFLFYFLFSILCYFVQRRQNHNNLGVVRIVTSATLGRRLSEDKPNMGAFLKEFLEEAGETHLEGPDNAVGHGRDLQNAVQLEVTFSNTVFEVRARTIKRYEKETIIPSDFSPS